MKKAFQWAAHVTAFRNKYLAAVMMIAALFISTLATSQVDTTKVRQRINAYGYEWKNGTMDSSFRIPRDTFRLRQADTGSIAVKSNVLYVWSQQSGVLRWDSVRAIGTGGGSGTNNANVGSAFRLLNHGTQEIKTLANGLWINWDSTSTANSLKPNVDSAAAAGYFLRRKDSVSAYTTLVRFMDSVNNRLINVYERNDSVFVHLNGAESFRFKVGEVNLGGIFDDPNNTIYTGVFRATSSQVAGTDIIWDWIEDNSHVTFGFSSHIEAGTTGPLLYYPQGRYIHSIIIGPDEQFAVNGVTVGAKFTKTFAEVWSLIPGPILGARFAGNGSGGITAVSSSLTGWNSLYVPNTGNLRFDYPTGYQSPSYMGAVLSYEGTNSYQLERMTSGLGGYGTGWIVRDLAGNIADTLTTSDKFSITSTLQSGVIIKPQIVGSTNDVILDAGLKNFWVIAIVSRDVTTPSQNQITTIDSTTTSGQNVVTWSSSTLADTYYLDRSTHYNYGYTNVYTGANLNYTDTGLTPGTRYYYRVRAGNIAANPDTFSGWESKGFSGTFSGRVFSATPN